MPLREQCVRNLAPGAAYMGVDRVIFRKHLAFRRAPDWVQCELCERKGPRLPARFVMAVNEEEAGQEQAPAEQAPAESNTLVLLCVDCSALVDGAIDANEWRRRTNPRPA